MSFSDAVLRRAVIVVGIIYVIQLFLFGWVLSPFDYDHLAGYYEIAWRFWRGMPFDLPHFNPLLCGGRTLGGDPQVPIFHPLLFLVPLVGAVWFIKLELLLQLALGAYGLWRLLQHFHVTPPGRWWGIFLFLAGGGTVAKVLVGHVTLGFYLLLPLLFALSYRLSSEKPFDLKFLTGYLAVFAYAGLYKPNFLIYAVPALGVEVIVRTILKRSPRPLLYFVGGVVFCATINAVNYLPARDYFTQFPRLDGFPSKWIPPHVLLLNLLLPLKTIPNDWYGPFFLQRHEYNIFLGPVAVWLAYLGFRKLNVAYRAEAWGLFALLVVSAWIGFGTPGEGTHWGSPFSWLVGFWPGFASVRVPTRFWFAVSFVVIIFSAVGFHNPRGKHPQRAYFALGILPLLVACAVNLGKMTIPFPKTQWATESAYVPDFSWEEGDADHAYLLLRRGIGSLNCLYNLEVYQAAKLRPGRLLEPLEGTARYSAQWVTWNRVRIDGPDLKTGESVMLNFNASPYWRFEGQGIQLESRLGRPLTLKTIANGASGELIFEQPKVREGAFVSLCALAIFLLLVAGKVLYFRKKGHW